MTATQKTSFVGGAVVLFLLAMVCHSDADPALSHFIVTAVSDNNMTVLAQSGLNPTIDGSPLVSGDEIGVFTPEGLCVGGVVWNGTTQTITVWGDNDQTTQVDGMVVGEKLYYRIWRASDSKEVLAFATYNTASQFSRSDSTYMINGVSILAGLSGISAPNAPTISTPANNATDAPLALTLIWNAAPAALSYAVQVSTDAGFSTTVAGQSGLTALMYAISGLTNVTSYYWRVNATDAGGTGIWSGVAQFTTRSHFTVAGTTGNSMTFLARSGLNPTVDGAALPPGNEIGIFSSSGLCVGSGIWNGSTTIITVWGDNDQTPQIDGMVSGEKLYFHIWNCAQSKEFLAVPTFSLTDPFAKSDSTYVVNGVSVLSGLDGYSGPAVPSLVSPTDGFAPASLTPTLTWSSGSSGPGYGPTLSYSVQVSMNADFSATVFSGASLNTASVPISAGLTNSTMYYWHIDAAGPGGISAWSGARSFTTIIAAPDVPALSLPTDNGYSSTSSPVLKWTAAARAATYALQVAASSDFSTTIINQSGLTDLASTMNALVGTVFYWRVAAVNVNCTSAWSASWQFTTATTLTIPLVAGWNMKSFNNHPVDSSVTAIFNHPKGFIVVKDIEGNTYVPTVGIEDLDVLHTGCGYQIYSRVLDTIAARGEPVDVATTTLAINKGWNIIAFLPQTATPIETEFAAVSNQILIAKNSAGDTYLPNLNLDDIGDMNVGEAYMIYAKSAFSFTYTLQVSKHTAGATRMLSLPSPRHFAITKNTGNNATFISSRITMQGASVPDRCEIGAFDEQGNLVGAGSVVSGRTAFAVWGDDPQTKEKDGCATGEVVQLRIWDGKRELPLDLTSGTRFCYETDGIFIGALAVPEGRLISCFALSMVYPNPFKNNVRIAFDVPTMSESASSEVEISAFDMKGMLVHRIAGEKFAPGHYTVSWNGAVVGGALCGPGSYVIRMKAPHFEKRVQIINVR